MARDAGGRGRTAPLAHRSSRSPGSRGCSPPTSPRSLPGSRAPGWAQVDTTAHRRRRRARRELRAARRLPGRRGALGGPTPRARRRPVPPARRGSRGGNGGCGRRPGRRSSAPPAPAGRDAGPAGERRSTSARGTRSCSSPGTAIRCSSTPGRRTRTSPGSWQSTGSTGSPPSSSPTRTPTTTAVPPTCSARLDVGHLLYARASPATRGAARAAAVESERVAAGFRLRSGGPAPARPLAASRTAARSAGGDRSRTRSRSSCSPAGTASGSCSPATPRRSSRRFIRATSTCSRSLITAARTPACRRCSPRRRRSWPLISVGADNPYGHPAAATLEALRGRGRAGRPHRPRRRDRDLGRGQGEWRLAQPVGCRTG